MKTLFLVRHAKSDHGHAGLTDHERPLNARGRRDLPQMGARLGRRPVRPERILSSTAVRARETAEGLGAALDLPEGALSLHPELYLAAPEQLLEVLLDARPAADAVALVAHNPGLEELASLLGLHERMPTLGIATISRDVDAWDAFPTAPNQATHFEAPKIPG